MFDRLDLIVRAFELDDGSFELWSLTPEQYRSDMRDSAGRGPSAGRLGMVARGHFEKHGRSLGRVMLS